MKRKRSRLRSDDSENNSIKKENDITNNVESHNHHNRQNTVMCEFCDEVFLNRFSCMVHNASHIIIPLIKQHYVQCNQCLHHFVSEDELRNHIMRKHPETTDTSSDKSEPKLVDIKMENDDITHLSDDSLDLGLDVKGEYEEEGDVELKIENNLKAHKFIFENDLGLDDDLLNDFTTDCKVNLDDYNSWFSSDISCDVHSVKSELDNEEVEKEIRRDVCNKSVHYDDLMRPGIYRCRCGEAFPNRYELIRHDKGKVIIKKPRVFICTVCDKYITGNYHRLNKHIKTVHPNHDMNGYYNPRQTLKNKINKFPTCNICRLKYSNYKKHCRNYHDSSGETKSKTNASTSTENRVHKCVVNEKKSIKVCDVCCIFMKNRHNLSYRYIGEVHGEGTRVLCERCCRKYFTLKHFEIIRREYPKPKEKLVDRILFERDPMERENSFKKPKTITNADRLKNIQQRLKMLNKLSKF